MRFRLTYWNIAKFFDMTADKKRKCTFEGDWIRVILERLPHTMLIFGENSFQQIQSIHFFWQIRFFPLKPIPLLQILSFFLDHAYLKIKPSNEGHSCQIELFIYLIGWEERNAKITQDESAQFSWIESIQKAPLKVFFLSLLSLGLLHMNSWKSGSKKRMNSWQKAIPGRSRSWTLIPCSQWIVLTSICLLNLMVVMTCAM
jgi:hypothetical protein